MNRKLPTMTMSAFAKFVSVPRGTISSAVASGSVVLTSAGRVDPCHPANAVYIAKRYDKMEQKKLQEGAPPPDLEEYSKLANRGGPGFSTDIDCTDPLDLMRLSRADQTALKDVQAIRDKEIKIREARGELIERDLVVHFFGRLHSIDVNQFRTMGANAAPEVAALLGVSAQDKILLVEKFLEDEVFARLQNRKTEIDKFIDGIEKK